MLKNQAAASTAATGSIDDAELCQSLEDYHGVGSRVAAGILFRSFLDSTVTTPFEVIHSAKAMKALTEQGTVVENAAIRVAMVQARLLGQEQKSRKAAILKALEETQSRARSIQLDFAGLPRGVGPADWLLSQPASFSPTGDRARDRAAAVALDLAERRAWSAKFERVFDLIRQDREERLLPAVDAALADLMTTPAAVQEQIGGPPLTLGAQLVQLCAMALGRTASVAAGGSNRLAMVGALLRQGKLPETRAAILERVRRHLRGPHPLGRAPADDPELLNALLTHLLTPAGVVGGTPMADAITIRYSRRLEQGGSSAYRQSIAGVAEMQSDLFARIHYLAAVSRAPGGERQSGEIVAVLDAALGNELLVGGALVQTTDLDRLRDLLRGAAAALRVAALPPGAGERIAARIDHLLEAGVRSGQILARLRQTEPVARRRVIRLAELAASGLLSEDGGLSILRQQIMDAVRQPQFQADLAAPQASDVAQSEVRRLLDLLDRLRQAGGGAAARPQAAGAPAAGAPRAGPVDPSAATISVPAVEGGDLAVTVAIPLPVAQGAAAARRARCPYCFADAPAGGACSACGYPGSSTHRPGVHLPPGSPLHGRYEVGRLLGQGGFGATYLGWDDRLSVKVAVKEYFPANLVSRLPGGGRVAPLSDVHAEAFELGLGKFLEEARLLAALRDIKEIVVVQDFFQENATAYIVMELLQGRTLKRYLVESGGAVEMRRALAILSPIMRALQQVHDQGLIHRDVSPDNIFITASGERKLLDFGAARHAASQAAGLTVILKPGYAPPEQYSQEGSQGPWTDVYALCATLYCALTGKAPPDATARFIRDTLVKPSDVGVRVAPAAERVLMSGLALRPIDRPQSMRELLKALTAAVG